ncbi:MAG: hypothetical protein IJ757_02175 [Clostridiales bacterium]|nr:hypothetical protein [Clostridiales bacterium]
MRRFVAVLLAVVGMTASFTGCLKRHVPKGWYEDAIAYYQDGFNNNWSNIDPERHLNVSNEQRNPAIKFGYLLKDLDGDGAEELLIGIIEPSGATKFTDVIVYHYDLGEYDLLSGGEGYYIYLCNGDVLRVDSWYGSETQSKYMRYDSSDSTFPYVTEGNYAPMRFELTPF